MDLQQEYFDRNGITAPVIRYTDRNFLVVHNKKHKENGYPRLMVVQMAFTNKPDTHPGTFKFNQMVPVHDNNSLKSIWEKKLEWDEWESFLHSWADSNKPDFVPCEEDPDLACWEMFAYTHDTWLSQNLPPYLQDKILVVLDSDVDPKERKKAGTEIEGHLKQKNRQIAQGLHNFRAYTDSKLYATWLAKLLK